MKNTTFKLWITIFVVFFSSSNYAENTAEKVADDQQPIKIQSDQLKASEKAGQSTYMGNVEIDQGSLKLNGDKLEVAHPNGSLDVAIITGKPAKFKRFNTQEQSWVHGEATTIEYSTKDKTVLFLGNARIEQPGKQLISGPKLLYDIDKQTLQAESTPEDNKRISVTFTPANANKTETDENKASKN